MLELLLCSVLTVLPDYLYRTRVQGKRWGREITFFSLWFELRWGLTTCLMLTVALITVIFYFHPSTSNVVYFYKVAPIVPESAGRVSRVLVSNGDLVQQGATIFELDKSRQQAALDAAARKVAETDAALVVAQSDLLVADGQIQQAEGALKQAQDELDTRTELRKRNADVVATREIERLEATVASRQGAVAAAVAGKQGAQARLTTLLPAQKASAEAALAQAQVELDKMVVVAGVTGHVEQFALQAGDFVNPFMRAAGVLVPVGAGRPRLQAGFGQVEAQVIRPGMIAEAVCISKPFTIIPMVITDVQGVISAGQFRTGDQLIDAQQVSRPGTILAQLDPLYPGGLDDVTPGSHCVANAYSNHHHQLETEKMSTLKRVGLHAVDTVAVVHAMLLRIQALMLPVTTLVLSGH